MRYIYDFYAKSIKKILFIFIGIAFFAGVAYIIFINNVFGLADFYKSSDYFE